MFSGRRGSGVPWALPTCVTCPSATAPISRIATTARWALSVQPVFSQGLVYAPLRDWSDMVKSEMALFPKGRYKDLTDSATQALKWMRVRGLIQRPEDIALVAEARQEYRRKPVVLYRA